MSDMTDLGIKRKDQYPREETVAGGKKDYDNEKIYPSIDACGKLAELMGAADLNEGDVVEAPFKLKVKRLAKTDENGKTHYDIKFDIIEMGDMTDSSSDEDDGSDDEEDEESSPALAVLSGPRDGYASEND
jgi:hypothetical protein